MYQNELAGLLKPWLWRELGMCMDCPKNIKAWHVKLACASDGQSGRIDTRGLTFHSVGKPMTVLMVGDAIASPSELVVCASNNQFCAEFTSQDLLEDDAILGMKAVYGLVFTHHDEDGLVIKSAGLSCCQALNQPHLQ